MGRFSWFVAAYALVLSVGASRADTYETFDISGTYTTYASKADVAGSFTGTLSIDITADTVNSLTVTLPDILIAFGPPFTDLSANQLGSVVFGNVLTGPEVGVSLIPNGDGFYSGGSLGASGITPPGGIAGQCGINPAPCDAAVFSFGGVLTPDPALTPLPATLPLFATGLGALGLLARRRKRKAAFAA